MFILLLFVIEVLGEVTNETRRNGCDGLLFFDVYYDRELLFDKYEKAYNLVIHKYSGALFFSHTFEYAVRNKKYKDFKISYCFLDVKECGDVKGIPGGYAIAYDRGNDDLYFGGHDGIYKYNFLSNTADFFTQKNVSIWGLFVKKNFYYIEYPSQTLFVYNDGVFVKVSEAEGIEVDNLLISEQGHVYFSNETAVFKQDKNTKETMYLSDMQVRQIVEDLGDIYFVTKDGIYKEEISYRHLVKVADLEDVYGLAFDDKGRVIYSDNKSINRLTPNPDSFMCDENLRELEVADTTEGEYEVEIEKHLLENAKKLLLEGEIW